MTNKPDNTRREIRRLDEPELMLVKRGAGSDPRLVELARLLARRAAREWYEEQSKDRGATRS